MVFFFQPQKLSTSPSICHLNHKNLPDVFISHNSNVDICHYWIINEAYTFFPIFLPLCHFVDPIFPALSHLHFGRNKNRFTKFSSVGQKKKKLLVFLGRLSKNNCRFSFQYRLIMMDDLAGKSQRKRIEIIWIENKGNCIANRK